MNAGTTLAKTFHVNHKHFFRDETRDLILDSQFIVCDLVLHSKQRMVLH